MAKVYQLKGFEKCLFAEQSPSVLEIWKHFTFHKFCNLVRGETTSIGIQGHTCSVVHGLSVSLTIETNGLSLTE